MSRPTSAGLRREPTSSDSWVAAGVRGVVRTTALSARPSLAVSARRGGRDRQRANADRWERHAATRPCARLCSLRARRVQTKLVVSWVPCGSARATFWHRMPGSVATRHRGREKRRSAARRRGHRRKEAACADTRAGSGGAWGLVVLNCPVVGELQCSGMELAALDGVFHPEQRVIHDAASASTRRRLRVERRFHSGSPCGRGTARSARGAPGHT